MDGHDGVFLTTEMFKIKEHLLHFGWTLWSRQGIVRFDPTRCPWNALRDVIYARQNTNMNRLDICKALKVLYPDEIQFQTCPVRTSSSGRILKPCLIPHDAHAMHSGMLYMLDRTRTWTDSTSVRPSRCSTRTKYNFKTCPVRMSRSPRQGEGSWSLVWILLTSGPCLKQWTASIRCQHCE